jgi:hypothetical protein
MSGLEWRTLQTGGGTDITVPDGNREINRLWPCPPSENFPRAGAEEMRDAQRPHLFRRFAR